MLGLFTCDVTSGPLVRERPFIPLPSLFTCDVTSGCSTRPLTTCEASLELVKLDVECLLRSCFHLLYVGKSLSFHGFFIVGNKKKSQGAMSGE